MKFKNKIYFDKNYPDGTLRKTLNSNKIRKLGWKPTMSLTDGLKKVISSR